MWMRFAALGPVGKILGADQALYRIHRRNMHIGYHAAPVKDLIERKAAFDTVFAEFGSTFPGRERLLDLAHRRLAREALGIAGQLHDRGQTGAAATELVDFAMASYPRASRTIEYLGLRLRRLLGPRLTSLVGAVREARQPRWRGTRLEQMLRRDGRT
jgi:hypothetical protein